MNKQNFRTQICKSPQELAAVQDAEMALLEGLGHNIIKQTGITELGKSLKIFLRDEFDQVRAGVIAQIFGGWLYISLMWVEETYRNQGHGTHLVQLVESEAVQLGCQYAHVDTYSFEAKPFYEHLGYELFATLQDYPIGYCKYFLKKQLVN